MNTLFPILLGVKIGDGDKFGYGFYDFDAKITRQLSDVDKLSLNFYSGRDVLGVYSVNNQQLSYPEKSTAYTNDSDFHWGNDHIAANWTRVLSPRMFLTTVLGLSRYRMNVDMVGSDKEYYPETGYGESQEYNVDYNSGIKDVSISSGVEYYATPSQHIRFGVEAVYHSFKPESFRQDVWVITDFQNNPDTTTLSLGRGYDDITRAADCSLYAEDEISLGRLLVNPGLRLNVFRVNGRAYFRPQPRLSASFDISDCFSVKASYARMSQNVHLLTSTQVTLPMDLWVPVTDRIKPMVSDQYVAGMTYRNRKGWEFSLEGYYKDVSNVVEYKDGVVAIGNTSDWEDRVVQGKGRSRGVELFLNKYAGSTTGWISYTLSKTERRFQDAGISGGEWFPFKYDRRHILNMVVIHSFGESLDISGSWSLATGGVTTVPTVMTAVLSPDGKTLYETEYVPRRGNYRLPSSHSLNLGMNLHRQKRRGEAVWSFNVFNLYNHLNPDLLYDYRPEIKSGVSSTSVKMKVKVLTLIPILPSIGYSFKF